MTTGVGPQPLIYFGVAGGSLALALSLLYARYVRHDPQAVRSRGGFTLLRSACSSCGRSRCRWSGFRPGRPLMGDPADAPIGSAFRIVGVIHLPPLPGSARGSSARDMHGILESVRRDTAAWAIGGADALIVENFGDVPFARELLARDGRRNDGGRLAGERREWTAGGGECASQ